MGGISSVNRTQIPFNKGTEQNGKIVVADMSSSYYDPTRMIAKTEGLKGDSTLYYNNIQFALMEREGLDLEIYSDLVNVITTIKGQEQTYEYGRRNISARLKDEVYNNVKYTQGIYASDYTYKKELYGSKNYKNTDELEIYATYYMKIYNASTSSAYLTELVNYYDSGYESIVTSAYSYKNQVGIVTWNTASKYARSKRISIM